MTRHILVRVITGKNIQNHVFFMEEENSNEFRSSSSNKKNIQERMSFMV